MIGVGRATGKDDEAQPMLPLTHVDLFHGLITGPMDTATQRLQYHAFAMGESSSATGWPQE